MLQCVAVCCSVLQCVAVCCSVLQRVAVCCSVCSMQIGGQFGSDGFIALKLFVFLYILVHLVEITLNIVVANICLVVAVGLTGLVCGGRLLAEGEQGLIGDI